METIHYPDIHWQDIQRDNIAKTNIWENTEKGGATLWKMPKGSGFDKHNHKGYEHIYVISGRVDFSGNILNTGDFLLTQKGEEHEAYSLEDSIILVINERANR